MNFVICGLYYGLKNTDPKKPPFFSLGRKTLIKKRLQDIDRKQLYLLVEIWHTEHKSSQVILPRSEVYAQSGKALLDAGADLSNKKLLLAFLNEQENQLPMEYRHSDLGFGLHEGQILYKAAQSFPLTSIYNGSLEIKPVGTFEAWQQTVAAYAMPQLPLQLGLTIGLASITTGMLRNELDGSLLTHVFGNSSTGKTTLAMLALSTACNPDPLSQNTLFCDWSDTQYYRLSLFRNNNGFPIVVDELSKAKERDISTFCYDIANGRERGRLNSDSTRKETASWATTAISTGEASLLARCNQNKGILVRVLEFRFDSITGNAQEAEALKAGILQNYGHANPMMACYLLKHEKVIKKRFFEWRKKIVQDLPIQNELSARLSKKLAVLLLTAEIGKEVLQLDFDIDGLQTLLNNAILEQNTRIPFDMGEMLIQFLLEDMVSHPDRYHHIEWSGTTKHISNNRVAIVKDLKKTEILKNGSKCRMEIQYLPERFKTLLLDNGFTDANLAVSELKKKGFLAYEEGHNMVKRRIDGRNLRVYVVRFPDEYMTTDKWN